MNGKLCGDSSQDTYAERCDFSSDRYSCAPGDLSARTTEVMQFTADPYTLTIEGPNTLIPPVGSLVDKVIGIHCPYEDSSDLTFLACAPIEAVVTTTATPDDNGVASISFVAAIVASFIALLF